MPAAGSAQSLGVKAKLFRGISDPSRLSLLEALRAHERTVTELVELTGLTQSNASNHLNCLLDCGLVEREQQGRFAVYRLSDPRVETILETADILLAEVARGVYECVRYAVPQPSSDSEVR